MLKCMTYGNVLHTINALSFKFNSILFQSSSIRVAKYFIFNI